MQLRLSAVLGEAWAMFRRDRDWLPSLSAPFLFLPPFALALLVPGPPPIEAGDAGGREASALAWAQTFTTWFGDNGHWYLLAYAVSAFGMAAIYAAYLDRGASDLRAALRSAASIFPRFLLATVMAAVPVGAGLLLYVLPGLYVMGRTLAVGPSLVAERPLSASGAIGRSFRLTRGAGLPLMALSSVVLLGGYLLGAPFAAMSDSGVGGRLVGALAAAGVGAASMLANTAQALVAVVAYRRLGAR